MNQLSALDASFLYSETPSAPGHIFSLAIYDPSSAPGGRVTHKGILEHVERRLHLARTFRQRAVEVPFHLDHPYWIEDPDFDLEHHIRHIALPAPGDWRQLCIQVAALHSRHLDRSRPLWELFIIEGLDNVEGSPPGSFALMLKTHHAAIDGVTLMEITSAINDTSPDAPVDGPATPWAPEPEPSDWDLLGRTVLKATRQPARMVDLLTRLGRRSEPVPDPSWELPPDIAGQSAVVPHTRFSGPVSAHRVFEARRFDLADAKRMRRLVPGSTVNDVAIAVIGGALRDYLQHHGELPDESLRVMAPISTRTEEQRGTGGNQVTAMVVVAGTDIADPTSRLAAVHASSHRSKAFVGATGARDLVEFSELMPGGLAALSARTAAQFEMATHSAPVINTVVSNVPGPQVPLYCAGARLVSLYAGAGVVDGMGLFHLVTSYCGELSFSVASCRSMLPDPGRYADCIGRSFATYRRAADELDDHR